MRRFAPLIALTVLVIGAGSAQQWSNVWKLTTPPYLTIENILDMGMVKAGFDTDKDGWGEIICTWTDRGDTNAIMMYEADGNNSYKLVWSTPLPFNSSLANSYAGIAVGDLNNNGVVEIITTLPSIPGTDPNPLRLWVYEWSGVAGQNAYGFFNSATKIYDPSGGWNYEAPDNYDLRPYSLIIEDIDKDGKNELISGIRQGGSGSSRQVIVSSVEGDFGGFVTWNLEWKYAADFAGANYSTTTGDLDNDGNREIYMFMWNFFTMRIFECTGDKNYTEVYSLDTLYKPQGIDYGALDAVRVADVNRDGVNEMYIAGTQAQNKIFIITDVTDVSKMTTANIKELYSLPATGSAGLKSMYIADPDHDGNADLMIGGERNGKIFSLEYKGTGNPADSANWQHQILFDIAAESAPIATSPRLFYGHPAKDMDKDGKDEYVFVNYSPDYSIWPGDSPLWVIEIDVVSDVQEEDAGIPEEIHLMQNFPNPFNPSTTIPFKLSSRSRVQLDVFDVYGQHIAALVNADREPGFHQARWTANAPSGTYFCRLLVEPLEGMGGPFREVKKMLLVR